MTGCNSRTSTSVESYFRSFFDQKHLETGQPLKKSPDEFPQDFNFRTILFKECHCSKMSQAPEPASRRCLGELVSVNLLARKKEKSNLNQTTDFTVT